MFPGWRRSVSNCVVQSSVCTTKREELRKSLTVTVTMSCWSKLRNLDQACWRHINKTLVTAKDEGNSKPFWRYIKLQRKYATRVSPLKDVTVVHTDPLMIQKLLENINPTQAGGPGEVPGKFFQGGSHWAPFLTHLYKKSLDDGKVPLAWNK